MRRGDAKDFADFMIDEAVKYSRDLTKAEIDTWFENFPRTTMEDFKLAWVAHKRDPKNGQFFPKIVDLQRVLRTTGDATKARDWRCTIEVGDQRCGFPGSVTAVGLPKDICSAHYRLFQSGTDSTTQDRSSQIIEASREYRPPKTEMELMEMGERIRAHHGAAQRPRFKALHESMAAALAAKGAGWRDPAQVRVDTVLPPKPQPSLEVDLDAANAAAQLAAQESA